MSSQPEDPKASKYTARQMPELDVPNQAAPIGKGEESESFTKQSRPDPESGYMPSRRQSAECISNRDRLNRSRLVEALATVLSGDNDHHQTIGLLGDWGVGKSTTVHLLKQALWARREQQPFLFGTFNAWEYEHTNNLQAGMAQEMLKALSSYPISPESADSNVEKGAWSRLRSVIAPVSWWFGVRLPMMFRFAVALHGSRLLVLAVLVLLLVLNFSWQDMETMAAEVVAAGTGAQMMMGGGVAVVLFMFFRQIKALLAMPLAKEWLTYMKLPDYGEYLGSIPVMRKQISTLCRVRLQPALGRKKRLLFLVDDLDRCGQEGIVKVFEAVRLVLDIPQVTVIIAVDQRIALAALALHYQELAQHHRLSNPQAIARDYLAKVIHTPITLTPADAASISGYLDAIWQETSATGSQDGHADRLIQSNADAGAKVSEQVQLGLSEQQKLVFKKWVQHFGFTNPRQLKRLHNSYNLLRHFYGEDGQLSRGESTMLDSLTTDLGSPMLITLFALEYINSLEDSQLRGHLLSLVREPRERSFRADGDAELDYVDPTGKITEDVLQVVTGKLAASGIACVQAVEPFVLPCIVQGDAMPPRAEDGAG